MSFTTIIGSLVQQMTWLSPWILRWDYNQVISRRQAASLWNKRHHASQEEAVDAGEVLSMGRAIMPILCSVNSFQ